MEEEGDKKKEEGGGGGEKNKEGEEELNNVTIHQSIRKHCFWLYIYINAYSTVYNVHLFNAYLFIPYMLPEPDGCGADPGYGCYHTDLQYLLLPLHPLGE